MVEAPATLREDEEVCMRDPEGDNSERTAKAEELVKSCMREGRWVCDKNNNNNNKIIIMNNILNF